MPNHEEFLDLPCTNTGIPNRFCTCSLHPKMPEILSEIMTEKSLEKSLKQIAEELDEDEDDLLNDSLGG